MTEAKLILGNGGPLQSLSLQGLVGIAEFNDGSIPQSLPLQVATIFDGSVAGGQSFPYSARSPFGHTAGVGDGDEDRSADEEGHGPDDEDDTVAFAVKEKGSDESDEECMLKISSVCRY